MTDELEPLTPAEGLARYLDDMQAEYAEATLYSKKSRIGHLLPSDGANREASTISTS